MVRFKKYTDELIPQYVMGSGLEERIKNAYIKH